MPPHFHGERFSLSSSPPSFSELAEIAISPVREFRTHIHVRGLEFDSIIIFIIITLASQISIYSIFIVKSGNFTAEIITIFVVKFIVNFSAFLSFSLTST